MYKDQSIAFQIRILTHTDKYHPKSKSVQRTIRMGCAGKDDLLERVRALMRV